MPVRWWFHLFSIRGEDLAPTAYGSDLSPAETERLAMVSGCENFRSYLDHNEFTLYTDNQHSFGCFALRSGQAGLVVGCFVQPLFMFSACHIAVKSNLVAHCGTRQFEDLPPGTSYSELRLQHLPPAFQSDYQIKDLNFRQLYGMVSSSDNSIRKFKLHNDAIVSFARPVWKGSAM
jgi:hypothetical protein